MTLSVEKPSYPHLEQELLTLENTQRKVGGRALQYYAGDDILQLPPLGGFDHLFPATELPAELLVETRTSEDAEKVLDVLTSGSSYRDFAFSELTLYYLQAGDLKHAYRLLGNIGDPNIYIRTLSHLVVHLGTHKESGISTAGLHHELREHALATHKQQRSTESAKALIEASEALPDDLELRTFARAVLLEHPELQPDLSE